MKLKRYVLGCYAIWVVLLIAVYYALPGLHVETWGLISLSGVAAIILLTCGGRLAGRGAGLCVCARSAIASMCAGVVPQQPPTIVIP